MRKNAYESPRFNLCFISDVDVLTTSGVSGNSGGFNSENLYDTFW